MLTKKPIICLVSLNLVLFLGFGGNYLYQRSQNDNAKEQVINAVGQSYERFDIMTKVDYKRIVKLADSIEQSNSISDADLDWWINLVNCSTSSKSGQDTSEDHRLAALKVDFENLTATPQQQDRLFELAKSYLPAPGQSTGKDLFFGVALINAMDEKRAAPLLTQFLNRQPQSYVRQMAEKTLKDWSSRQPLK